jgi:glycerol-3-phosphate acyltransferase PlsX
MKEKSDSSLVIACKLCKDGVADAVVSAGNTGALFTAASLIIRRIKGVRRAALGSVLPLETPFVLLDCGANLDATPDVLDLYARMGSIYAENVLGVERPRVGLLNNGTEPHKGTQLYVDAHALLSKDETINFVGNCEGKAIPFGCCDVLVCDGFTGNITLKLIEGMAKFMSKTLKDLFHASTVATIAGAMTLKHTKRLKKRLDPSEYGGAPFLGLAKPVVKAHGSSDAYSFRSAIKQVLLYCKNETIEKISANIMWSAAVAISSRVSARSGNPFIMANGSYEAPRHGSSSMSFSASSPPNPIHTYSHGSFSSAIYLAEFLGGIINICPFPI